MSKMIEMSKDKEVFAAWLAVPKKLREPRTQKELAVVLNVQPETLSRWKKDPVLQERVFEMARSRLEVALPDVLEVIADKAKKGNIHFVKLMLELTHKHSEKVTVRQEVPEVGIERWKGILEKVAQWEEERFGN